MKRIAVVTGGNSSEYVISVKSADTIIENIDVQKYIPFRVEVKGTNWFVTGQDITHPIQIDKNDFTFNYKGQKTGFDKVIVMIHGDPGEDGRLQGYFDMLKIPYTSSGVVSSAITFNKLFAKTLAQSAGVKTAKHCYFHSNAEFLSREGNMDLQYPIFVKPNNAGSSFGISRVSNQHELEDAVNEAFNENAEGILLEEEIKGTELTCGVLRTDAQFYAFPVTEIVSKTGFFDYTAKYTVGMADEIIPARIDSALATQIQDTTARLYELFHCKWFCRMDYIVNPSGIYFLEANTIPGMSKESIIPKMIREDGLALKDLLTEIIESN